jgi:hypothetical protein
MTLHTFIDYFRHNTKQPPADIQKIPAQATTDTIEIHEQSNTYKTFDCRHGGPVWFVLNMYGTKPTRLESKTDCPECLIEKIKLHSIRCANCGYIILPGEDVGLFNTTRTYLPHKNKGTFADRGNNLIIGCTRPRCCQLGIHAVGTWTEKGFIPHHYENPTVTSDRHTTEINP